MKQLTIIFSSSNPMPPENFRECKGHILYRDSEDIFCLWDGTEWVPLNRAGWFSKYISPFPDHVKIGNWAIIGPIAQARSKYPSWRNIDQEDFSWAMRNVQEDSPVSPDQSDKRTEICNECDEHDHTTRETQLL